jgi:asparagine synthase (glutamine-hydrolysing)
MCGIVGALSPEPVDPGLVERMRDRLAHRGPDAAGLWRSQDGRVCLGHRRLAVIDLSEEANQPFVSPDGRFVVTYNGELYNFRRLRAELERLGAVFRTTSDTEVLLEAFRAWGEACLDRLSGMFAFAIWDAREQRLFCARDRAGEKPFYYATTDGSFVFASELKSLLLWPGFRRELDYEALADFFVLGCVADPRTIWRGARKLAPGHALAVDLGPEGARVGTPRQWWDLVFEPDRTVTDWRPAILDTLERAVSEMAYADVPVGAFLSGGVDSSSIAAALTRTGHDVSTFTVGFAEFEFDEREWAREVARLFDTDHTERVVRAGDVGAVFPETVLWHYDEPFNDHSYLPTYYVSRAAREAITVSLSGDGGDETFAGYGRYRDLAAWTGRLPSSNGAVPAGRLPALVRSGATAVRARAARAVGARLAPPRRARPVPTGALYGAISTCLPENGLRSAARGPLAHALAGYSPRESVLDLLRKAPPDEVGLVNARRYLDLKLTLGSDILVKVDRASMAVSLEVRPVYLHRDVLELAARIPPERLADGDEAKKLLKSALEAWLPRGVLYRRKAGFTMPFGPWLRGELRTLLDDVRGEGRPLGELIEPAFVRKAVASHLAGTSDPHAGMTLHGLVFLDRWLERWT